MIKMIKFYEAGIVKIMLDMKNASYDKINETIEQNEILNELFEYGKEILEIENKCFQEPIIYTSNIAHNNKIYQVQEIISNEKNLYERLLILDITDALKNNN